MKTERSRAEMHELLDDITDDVELILEIHEVMDSPVLLGGVGTYLVSRALNVASGAELPAIIHMLITTLRPYLDKDARARRH